MILCADIGNSRIKFGLMNGDDVVARASVPTADAIGGHPSRVRDAIAACVGTTGVGGAAVSSVVPGATGCVSEAIAAVATADILAVDPATRMPVRIGVREPGTLGMDRVCAACGAVDAGARDAVVVDVGSAVTVDVVEDLVFRGGVIFPGPEMMLAALHACASQLPVVDLPPSGVDTAAIPGDTVSAMRVGALLAAEGGIRGAVKRMAPSARTPVWVTGGGPEALFAVLPGAWRRAPDLTITGLARIRALHAAD